MTQASHAPSLSGSCRRNTGIFPGQILTTELRKSILEGQLSSLQLPRLALNSFLSVPQEHQGQASSAPVGRPPRKTQAPGAACQNQTGGRGAPPPKQGDWAFPKSSLQNPAWAVPLRPRPRKQCLLQFSRNPQRREVEVTHMCQHFIPFLWNWALEKSLPNSQ